MKKIIERISDNGLSVPETHSTKLTWEEMNPPHYHVPITGTEKLESALSGLRESALIERLGQAEKLLKECEQYARDVSGFERLHGWVKASDYSITLASRIDSFTRPVPGKDVYNHPDCTWNYCPHPEECKKSGGCLFPLRKSKEK